MKSAAAGRMGVPTVPLTELYNAAGDEIRSHGGEVHLRAGVESFRAQSSIVKVKINGEERSFDHLILALPFDGLARILQDDNLAVPLSRMLSRFETSPITGIHLWFDRLISDLDHAVLLDRTIQWMFHKSKLIAARDNGQGSYVELVVSSSQNLVEKSRSEIVDLATREVAEFFPAAREAKLLKSTVIKEVHATYSPRPGVDAYRPQTQTAWPRVFLAGDFVATGWPATMEGAVRSGYQAVEALVASAGNSASTFLIPNLSGKGLMRFFD